VLTVAFRITSPYLRFTLTFAVVCSQSYLTHSGYTLLTRQVTDFTVTVEPRTTNACARTLSPHRGDTDRRRRNRSRHTSETSSVPSTRSAGSDRVFRRPRLRSSAPSDGGIHTLRERHRPDEANTTGKIFVLSTSVRAPLRAFSRSLHLRLTPTLSAARQPVPEGSRTSPG